MLAIAVFVVLGNLDSAKYFLAGLMWGTGEISSQNYNYYAWSDTVGWINFNPSFGSISYGVTVAEDGTFSGYAWGENTGWISFNCSNTSSCDPGVNYKVISDGQFYTQVAAAVTIQTQPAGSGCYLNQLATQPVILVKDQHDNNMPDGTVVTASLAGGTGNLTGTLTAATVNGVATFSNLGYSMPSQAFTIAFASGSFSANSNAVGPLSSDCSGGALGFEQSGTEVQNQQPGQSTGSSGTGGTGSGSPGQTGTQGQTGAQEQIPNEIIPILQNIIEMLKRVIERLIVK